MKVHGKFDLNFNFSNEYDKYYQSSSIIGIQEYTIFIDLRSIIQIQIKIYFFDINSI